MDLTPVYVQYVRFARRALEKKDRIAILSRGTKAGVGYQVSSAGWRSTNMFLHFFLHIPLFSHPFGYTPLFPFFSLSSTSSLRSSG